MEHVMVQKRAVRALPPEPNPLTEDQEMAKKRAVRALITETMASAIDDQTEIPQAGQTHEAVVALSTARASSSRPSKRARTSSTKPRLVDEEDPILPQNMPPSPELERSDGASPSEWAPKITYKNWPVSSTDSVVADKDHLLAFNLAKSVCLPADMEHHDHLTELKAIRSATKSMVLAMQKNHITHKRVLKFRKTAQLAVADANSRTAELQEAKKKMTRLTTEVARLTELVNSAEGDKQKALAELKDHYLRELAKIEKKKGAKIAELEKKMEGAEDRGYKEGEATYILQCEAAMDIFFKCGWKVAVAKLDHGQETEVFQNPPPHFIPSYMTEYANAIQQNFLEVEEEEASPEPNNTPVVANDPSFQTAQSARVEPLVPIVVDDVVGTDLPANAGLPVGEARVDLDADLDDLFA
ncbi:uncharacterized protein LOC114283977 [Camellia sinensis]|uniref:uncharacterized protein LOC114283977 n=1 Tax=Camellia sinensis TaxID=4442 RepID=UPI001035B195|nr:uncharacterized protein LOC114283977 [Camellia sinensis]